MPSSKSPAAAYATKENIVAPTLAPQYGENAGDEAGLLDRARRALSGEANDSDRRTLGGNHASILVDPAGANNSARFFAREAGTAGNGLTVEYVVPGGAGAALTLTYAAPALTVSSATAGAGVPSSTAADVIAAVNAHATIRRVFYAEAEPSVLTTGVIAAVGPVTTVGGSAADVGNRGYQVNLPTDV